MLCFSGGSATTAHASFLYPVAPFPTPEEPCGTFVLPNPSECTLTGPSGEPNGRSGKISSSLQLLVARRQRVCDFSANATLVRAWCSQRPNTEHVLRIRASKGATPSLRASKLTCRGTRIHVSHRGATKSTVFVADHETSKLLWNSGIVAGQVQHDIAHAWNATLAIHIVALDDTLESSVTLIPPGKQSLFCQPRQVAVFNWLVADATWTAAMYSFLVASFVSVTLLGSIERFPIVRMILVTTLLCSHVPVLNTVNFTSYVVATVLGCIIPVIAIGLGVCAYVRRKGTHRVRLPSSKIMTRCKEAIIFIVSSVLMLVLALRFALY